jgi:hypothetical protein
VVIELLRCCADVGAVAISHRGTPRLQAKEVFGCSSHFPGRQGMRNQPLEGGEA